MSCGCSSRYACSEVVPHFWAPTIRKSGNTRREDVLRRRRRRARRCARSRAECSRVLLGTRERLDESRDDDEVAVVDLEVTAFELLVVMGDSELFEATHEAA